MREYRKPLLTCYEHPDIGEASPSNAQAVCQADCAANTCDLVATCSAAPCDNCDTTDSCGTGINPTTDCAPTGC